MTEATLKEGEPHPAAFDAMDYVKSILTPTTIETLASVALSGNRYAEICLSTAQRLLRGDPVSDRYILGLAWLLRDMEEHERPLT